MIVYFLFILQANNNIANIRVELNELLQDIRECTIPELEKKVVTEQAMRTAALKLVEAHGQSNTPAAKKNKKAASKRAVSF